MGLTPLKRKWGSLTVKYKVSYKASRTPVFTALINRQTWSQLDATSPVVSGVGGTEKCVCVCVGGGRSLIASLCKYLREPDIIWRSQENKPTNRHGGDCSYKEKNTGHILIWLNLIRLWRSSCLTFKRRCVGTKTNTFITETAEERGN